MIDGHETGEAAWYAAVERLALGDGVGGPGAGVFSSFDERLLLSQPVGTASQWRLPVGSILSRRDRALPTILSISGVATMSTPMFSGAAPDRSLSWTWSGIQNPEHGHPCSYKTWGRKGAPGKRTPCPVCSPHGRRPPVRYSRSASCSGAPSMTVKLLN